MSKFAVIVSVQFLVPLPEEMSYQEAEAYGCDWLSVLDTDALEYRHPKIAGICLRPVPVAIKDMQADALFSDENLIQL